MLLYFTISQIFAPFISATSEPFLSGFPIPYAIFFGSVFVLYSCIPRYNGKFSSAAFDLFPINSKLNNIIDITIKNIFFNTFILIPLVL